MHARTQPRTLLDHPWRIASLVGVVTNVTFNLAHGRIGSPALSVADVSAKYPTLFTPAGYAFAIWGLIYGATLLYAVLAMLPSQLDVRFHDRVAPWLLLTNALSSLWVALFSAEQLGPSTLIILATLTCTVVMYSIAGEHLLVEHLSRFWRVPFGLWLGWLGIATVANLYLAFSAVGYSGWPFTPAAFTVILLGIAGIGAALVGALFLDPVVPLVASWAALAIAVEHWSDSTFVGVVALLVAAKLLFSGVRLLGWTSLPTPQGVRERMDYALRFFRGRSMS